MTHKLLFRSIAGVVAIGAVIFSGTLVFAVDYANPVSLNTGAQAPFDNVGHKGSSPIRVAYMPPATEFNYYIAIGEGIKGLAKEKRVEAFMLAPQSGADINGQMGMLQDVISQDVDAIILSTHDEHAAAPLVKRAVAEGIVMIIVNSDIRNFPTPVHGVVGYSQRKGTHKIGDYILEKVKGKPLNVAVIEGQPGYHSTERCGGFYDAIEGSNCKVVARLDGKWNVEGGNTAGMDLLQAHPEIELIFAANDYMIMGAALAAKALGEPILFSWAMTVTPRDWRRSTRAMLRRPSTPHPSSWGRSHYRWHSTALRAITKAVGSRHQPQSSTRTMHYRLCSSPKSSILNRRGSTKAREGHRRGLPVWAHTLRRCLGGGERVK